MTRIVEHFLEAVSRIEGAGYSNEIVWCRNRYLKDITADDFLNEYIFAVLSSSGLSNQIVQKNKDKFREAYQNGENAFDTIKNHRMKAAIMNMFLHYKETFEMLKTRQTDEYKIIFLETLPQIGKKERYHLARNLGIDCVKPDRHMERLAEHFGFKTPLEMCKEIQKTIPERLGVIDVILWRDCNLNGLKKMNINQKPLIGSEG